MKACPALKKLKTFDIGDRTDIYKNNRYKSYCCLLCVFIEYASVDNSEQYDGCKGIKLKNWLFSENLNVNEKMWYSSRKLDIRATKRTELTDALKSSENLLQKSQDLNSKRIHAQLAYELRIILPILIGCNNNVQYTNRVGETLLHIFVRGYLKKMDNFQQEQIIKLQKLFKYLVKEKAPFLVYDKSKKTALHIATTCKSIDILNTIISSFADAEEHDEFGNTALHIVVENCVDEEGNHKDGYIEVVRNLVSMGANVNAKNSDGFTPVHLAAQKFHVEILEFFAEIGANFNERTTNDEIPLHIVCQSTLNFSVLQKIIGTINLLASKGCDVNAVNRDGCTPLHFAAECRSVEVVEELLALGARVDCRTKETLLTPLYMAAKSDKLANMKALMRAGADVNAEGLDGSTPLLMSVMLGNYESMQFLIDRGADIYRRDNVAGLTMLHVVACDSDPKLKVDASVDRSQATDHKMRKLGAFIDKKFDIDDPATCGITPLHLAIMRMNIYNVETLIKCGANVNFQHSESQLTALHLACIRSHLEIAKVLIKNGADINRRGGEGQWTALHLALALEVQTWNLGNYPTDTKIYDKSYINKFWPEVDTSSAADCFALVKLLLENGAQVNVKDTLGRTPLHFATLRREPELIKLLLEVDAEVNVLDNKGSLPVHNVWKKNDEEGLKFLLDFGADINDVDTSELFMSSFDEMRNLAVKQAIKLKLVGLPCAKIYEPLFTAPEFIDFYRQYSAEAQNLINHYDDTGFSLFRFLQMNPKLQYRFIDHIANSYGNIDKSFPIYAALVRGTCRESAIRIRLLELARTAWAQISKINLPVLCVE